MDVWKIQLVLMAFCTLMQTYQAALSSTVREERRLSSAWQDESVDAGLTHQLLGLMKRSKALRFYGLMGKRSGLQSSSVLGNKGEAFVGLMGRSISSKGELKDLKRRGKKALSKISRQLY
uniref:Uncharacterized protein n=1 Tax=Takifugu rubripes TaxID=31033 RepID=A0A3B5K5E0_TAKRU